MYYSLLQWYLIILGMKSKPYLLFTWSHLFLSPISSGTIFTLGLFRVPRHTKFLPALRPLNPCSHLCFSGFLSYSIQLKPQISVPWTPNQKQSPKYFSMSSYFTSQEKHLCKAVIFSVACFSQSCSSFTTPISHFLQLYCLASNSSSVTLGTTYIICT